MSNKNNYADDIKQAQMLMLVVLFTIFPTVLTFLWMGLLGTNVRYMPAHVRFTQKVCFTLNPSESQANGNCDHSEEQKAG